METESSSSANLCKVEEDEEIWIRSCIDCHTTTTPCWRGGPSGPRTLCNACGIRYRKSRKSASSASTGVCKSDRKVNKKKRKGEGEESGGGGGGIVPVKKLLGLMGLDKWKRKYERFGEEEVAAILLMSLSSSASFQYCNNNQ